MRKSDFHEPIDIVYESVNDEGSVKCFFIDNLHFALSRPYCSKPGKDNDKLKIGSLGNFTTAAITSYIIAPLKNT